MEARGHPVPTIVVVGYAGSGKTTLCRALVARAGQSHMRFRELPATTMLTPNTEGERVVYDILLGREQSPPDAIVLTIDTLQVQQQLYLLSQVIDLRLPVVVALTMGDRAARIGVAIQHELLAGLLDVVVVPVHPAEGSGLEQLKRAIEEALSTKRASRQLHWRPSMGLADAYNHLDQKWIFTHLKLHAGARLIEGLRLLSSPRAAEEYVHTPGHAALVATLEEARAKLEARQENWTLAEVLQRHNWATQIAGQVIKHTLPERRMDRLMLRFRAAPAWLGWASIGAAALLGGLALYYVLGR
ncbi:MAG: FeoB small GTPase domain-containing protein [Rhodothermales bacterium]|nr:FeoB small GTPase domain-containing protein [Rhodothermales bacterium]